MKKIVLPVVFVLALGAAIVYRVEAVKRQDQMKREGIDSIQVREGFPVRVVPVRQGGFEVWRGIQGRVEGYRQAFISTPDPARVAMIRHRVGDAVVADKPIISLDENDPKNLSRIQLLRSVYEDALKEYERYDALFKFGGVSQEVMDKVRLKLKSARTDLDAARATVHLTSPIGGVLMSLSIREGENAEPGKTLGVVATLDRVRVVARISDRAAVEIRAGQPARVVSSAGNPHEGVVDRISVGADQESGLFDMEMVIENAGRELIPGTFVTAMVRVLHREDAYYVDSRCLARDFAGGMFVYQVKDGVAQKTVVRIIAENDDFAMIAGVDPVLPVVIDGQDFLNDGFGVRVLGAEDGE